MTTPDAHRRAAVALQYDHARDAAPRVTASGRGHVAERILALAHEQGVPVREDADLVQMLLQLDLHQEIPPELYQVIAEILAFVYQLNSVYRP